MLQIRKILFVFIAAIVLTACDMFKIDNYEGPNASLNGRILDAKTGDLVETDIQNGSRLQLQELGYPPGLLTRVIMQNGEYRDDMMFAGKYSIDFNNCNFYPFFVEEIEVKKGNNTRDFQVTPYIRVKNVNISFNSADSLIVATFNLEAGNDAVRLSHIRLYAHTDIYVGDQVHLPTIKGSFQQTFDPAIVINEATTYTLSIDLKYSPGNEGDNTNHFKYNRNFYFRVGALARVSNVGTVRRNYAPHVVIPLNMAR
jgi:hypothetical protein